VYDVVVFTENGHYYAKDLKGNIICVDSPTACIQEAINYLNNNGTIYIKSGVYNIYNTIYIEQHNNKITIAGSGRSTILKSYKTGDPPYMLRLNLAKGVTIRDLAVDGNGIPYDQIRESLLSFNTPTDLKLINLECFNTNTGACIDIGFARKVYMEGLYIHDNGSVKMSDAIHVGFSSEVFLYNSILENNTDAGIAFDNCEDVIVANSFLFYNRQASIFVWGADNRRYATLRTLIVGNHIVGHTGIWIGKYSGVETDPEGVNIVGNYIRDVDIGIRIDAGSIIKITGNVLRTVFSNATAIKIDSGFAIDISNNLITNFLTGILSNSNSVYIRRNMFINVQNPISGSYATVDDNMSMLGPSVLNRNTGQATIPAGATSVTVNHGLICTPTKVLITPLAQPPGYVWVSNITSSQFTINTSTSPTTDLPVAWYAEC
jgi:hypothetical protein